MKQSSGHELSLYYDPVVLKGLVYAYQDYFGDTVSEDTIVQNTRQQQGEQYANFSELRKENTRKRRILHTRRHRLEIIEEVRRWHARRAANGNGILSVGGQDMTTFATSCLRLEESQHRNLRVFTDEWEFIDSEFANHRVSRSPYNAIEQHRGRVKVYIGITGNIDDKLRPGQFIAQKYYGGDKVAAREDGWESHNLLSITDRNFADRRYNAAWAEHFLQEFMQSGPLSQKIDVEWNWVEPTPLHGENRSNIPNNGRINLYWCLKFV